ncbi:MAG TPA: ABC transporter permease [Gemmatimonadaceae bacterium]|nr:ABC transporter permease [Gemmatimonadaceae bacterium]
MVDWSSEIRARLAPLALSPEREFEIAEELGQHLGDRYAELRAHGTSDIDAQRAVREELHRASLLDALASSGRAEPAASSPAPGAQGGSLLASLWRDVRYGARSLRKAPGFTTIATITLALGIGATTAMFSVLDAVLLRPLPFAQPDQLVRVFNTYGSPTNLQSLSAVDFLALRADTRAFSSLASFRLPNDGFSYVNADRAQRVYGAIVSAGFFSTLGVRAMLGRTFQTGDDADGAPPTAVLSYAFWRERLGSDPAIIGKSINIQGRPTTVIGVMDASVWYPRGDRAELWINESFPTPKRRGPFGLAVLAREKPSVSAPQRSSALAQVAAGVRTQYPGGPDNWTYAEQSLSQRFSGPLRQILQVLMGAVVVVLLIACVNVTNLMLARATSREQEIAVRTALGASRTALVRQLLIEGALLALLGGAIGVLVAMWGVRALTSIAPDSLFVLRDFKTGIDARVLGLAALATMGSVLLFALAPAILGASSRAIGAVRDAVRGGTDAPSRRRIRSALVVAEFALSLVLLVGAGLLIRSLAKLRSVDTGVHGDGVITASIALPGIRYPKRDEINVFHDRLLADLRSRPAMEKVSTSVGLPPDTFGSSSDFFLSAHPVAEGEFSPIADVLAVDGEYFSALGIPLLSGRLIDSRDKPEATSTVLVSEALARKYFPGGNAIGERLNVGGPGEDNAYTIIGIVGNVRYDGLAQGPSEAIYFPFVQGTFGNTPSFSVVVRTRASADEVARLVRDAVHQIDPELAVANVRTVSDLVEANVAGDKFRTTLLAVFAALALVLAAVGIYGVMTYAVGRRAREIGIRLALGARAAEIYRLVLREALGVAGLGIGIGLLASIALTRVVSKLLFEVSATDAATFIAVPVLLLAIAAIACLVPAHRAARVDPSVTMRVD